MPSEPDALVYHATVSAHSTLAVDLDVTRRLGFDGLEASAAKMRAFLAAGHSEGELRAALEGVRVPGVGFLLDIERQGADRHALMAEAEALFGLAAAVGAEGVQVLTGPVDVGAVRDFAAGRTPAGYRGLLGLPREEQTALTAANLAALADLAAPLGLVLYLEALAWTPLNTVDAQVDIIRRAGRGNVRMVVDLWHCYASGDRPDRVAALDAGLIHGVHVCDSLLHAGGIPDEGVLRDVPTGAGVLDLKAWVDAVKATGYRGWWSCELFCRRERQQDSHAVAARLKRLMAELIRR